MRIPKIKLTKNNLVIAAAGAVIIVTLAIYMVIYMPLAHKLKTAYSECRLCGSRAADARNVIKQAGKTSGDTVLMAEKDVLFAIDELTKHGKAMGINFVSIKPQEIIDDKQAEYKILPIEMEIQSQDEQFSNFIGSLDSLKKAVITVKSFNVTADEHDRTRVKAHLTVDMYLSKREYAE